MTARHIGATVEARGAPSRSACITREAVTMQKLQPTLEQLHLAAVQLHESGPAYARFSVLLTDNTVELLAHEHIMAMVFRDGLSRERKSMHGVTRTQYTMQEVKRATGQDFSAKLSFLARHGVIDDDLRDFANGAHQIRNTVYHQGVRDEPILWSLAWHYHEIACDIFTRLQGGWSIHPDFPLSDLTRFLLDFGNHKLTVDEHLARAAEHLRAAKPARTKSLSEVLSDALCARLEQLGVTLDIAANDGPNPAGDIDELIRSALFREQYDFAQDQSQCDSDEEFRAWHARRDAAKAAFKPGVNERTLARWADRARELASSEATRALRQYQHLVREMTGTEEALDRLAWEIDLYNDQMLQEWKDER